VSPRREGQEKNDLPRVKRKSPRGGVCSERKMKLWRPPKTRISSTCRRCTGYGERRAAAVYRHYHFDPRLPAGGGGGAACSVGEAGTRCMPPELPSQILATPPEVL